MLQRFKRWSKKGVWQRVAEALSDDDLEWLMIDSTVARVHQHAADKRGKKIHNWDGNKGGFSTKVHAASASLGIPCGSY